MTKPTTATNVVISLFMIACFIMGMLVVSFAAAENAFESSLTNDILNHNATVEGGEKGQGLVFFFFEMIMEKVRNGQMMKPQRKLAEENRQKIDEVVKCSIYVQKVVKYEGECKRVKSRRADFGTCQSTEGGYMQPFHPDCGLIE